MKYHTNHTVFPTIHTVALTPPVSKNMQTPTPPPSSTPTSKRKRASADSGRGISPSPSRLKTTNLPSRPSLGGRLGSDIISEASPQTVVAGHLQTLDIQEQDIHVPKLDFGMGTPNYNSTGRFAPQVLLPSDHTSNESEPVTPPSSSHDTKEHSNLLPKQPSSIESMENAPVLEIPDSPSLAAVTSRTSLLTSSTPDPRLGNKSPVHTTNPPASSSRPSSPLSLWWTDTEITGHNPSDPTDDGYGINGVGFIPTPAMATARAEKRRRQVREWKEREARDARVRRGQRRQRNRTEIGAGDSAKVEIDTIPNTSGEERDTGRRVRFSDKMDTEI